MRRRARGDRDALVKSLESRASKAGQDRVGIVAGYYAQYFSTEPSYADLRRLEMAYKALKKTVADLNERFLDLLIRHMRCPALLRALEFPIALPDHAPVLVVAVPDFGAVNPAAVAADDLP